MTFVAPNIRAHLYRGVCFIVFSFILPLFVAAQDIPEKGTKLVNDYVGVLNATEQQALEQKLVAFYDSSATQIAVVIVKTVQPYNIEEFGYKLAQNWGIGQKGGNNGVLLLIAFDDHKSRIEVGYGLEPVIPDIIAKQLVQNDLKPNFKNQDYYQGIDIVTTKLMQYARGEFPAKAPKKKAQKNKGGLWILGIILLLMLFFIRSGKKVGGYATRNNIPFWLALGLFNSAGRSRGGSSWGDFSGGGGSSGGGFGGFGGGSFGGGGASGDW